MGMCEIPRERGRRGREDPRSENRQSAYQRVERKEVQVYVDTGPRFQGKHGDLSVSPVIEHKS